MNTVHTGTAIDARVALLYPQSAVVLHVYLTEGTAETLRTGAEEITGQVDAGSAMLAGLRDADIVEIDTAVGPAPVKEARALEAL